MENKSVAVQRAVTMTDTGDYIVTVTVSVNDEHQTDQGNRYTVRENDDGTYRVWKRWL